MKPHGGQEQFLGALTRRTWVWRIGAVCLAVAAPILSYSIGTRLAAEATGTPTSSSSEGFPEVGILMFLDHPTAEVDLSIWVAPNRWDVQMLVQFDVDPEFEATLYIAFADGWHLDTSNYRTLLRDQGIKEERISGTILDQFMTPYYQDPDGNLYGEPDAEAMDRYYSKQRTVQLFTIPIDASSSNQPAIQGVPGRRGTALTPVGRMQTVPPIQNWAYRCDPTTNNGGITDTGEFDPELSCPPSSELILSRADKDTELIAANRMLNNGNTAIHEPPDVENYMPNLDWDVIGVSLDLDPGWSVGWSDVPPHLPAPTTDRFLTVDPFWISGGLTGFRGIQVEFTSPAAAQRSQQKSLYAGIFLGVSASVMTSALLAAAGWLWRRPQRQMAAPTQPHVFDSSAQPDHTSGHTDEPSPVAPTVPDPPAHLEPPPGKSATID